LVKVERKGDRTSVLDSQEVKKEAEVNRAAIGVVKMGSKVNWASVQDFEKARAGGPDAPAPQRAGRVPRVAEAEQRGRDRHCSDEDVEQISAPGHWSDSQRALGLEGLTPRALLRTATPSQDEPLARLSVAGWDRHDGMQWDAGERALVIDNGHRYTPRGSGRSGIRDLTPSHWRGWSQQGKTRMS
jgi:hypothetical protein